MQLERKIFKTNVGGEELKIEVSEIGMQANAAVMGTYGGTTVFVTVVMDKRDKDIHYFPLSVDFEEKFYAAGKILGSRYVRREGKPSDEAILSARLIDRTIRPLFDHRIRRSIQVVSTILSYDEENDPDFVALITASIALGISDIPWAGPIAGVRMAKLNDNDEIFINPKNSFIKENEDKIEFETMVSGPSGRINMIELAGLEAKNENIISSYHTAISEFKKLMTFQEGIIESIGKQKTVIEFSKPNEKMVAAIEEFLKDRLSVAIYEGEKGAISDLEKTLKEHLVEKEYEEHDLSHVSTIYEEEVNKLIHEEILKNDHRPDGRKLDEVRDLYAEVGMFQRTHGSAYFIRGNTQALAATTLAAPGAEKVIETMERVGKKKFMLHYNFPPYSVGETGFFRGPGRRDIGHGALAEKTITALMPKTEDFPYTVRVVSEVLSSNGSSSMATVCATSLSLMDAGVPIKSPAAGIAMGVIVDEDTITSDTPVYKILTDIQGPEDHYGDMDLKVAGTKDGINAIQMDVKLHGVTVEIIENGIKEAEKARYKILDVMNKIISEPRKELSKYAPRILTLSIDPERIGEVIGSGGKIINGIIEKTGAETIDIEEDGRVYVTASNASSAEAAIKEIEAILKEYEVGEVVEGEVVKVLDFGAIVEFDGRDGMIHVSELKEGFVDKVEDVVKIGDKVKAKIIKVENGKIGLSLKQAK